MTIVSSKLEKYRPEPIQTGNLSLNPLPNTGNAGATPRGWSFTPTSCGSEEGWSSPLPPRKLVPIVPPSKIDNTSPVSAGNFQSLTPKTSPSIPPKNQPSTPRTRQPLFPLIASSQIPTLLKQCLSPAKTTKLTPTPPGSARKTSPMGLENMLLTSRDDPMTPTALKDTLTLEKSSFTTQMVGPITPYSKSCDAVVLMRVEAALSAPKSPMRLRHRAMKGTVDEKSCVLLVGVKRMDGTGLEDAGLEEQTQQEVEGLMEGLHREVEGLDSSKGFLGCHSFYVGRPFGVTRACRDMMTMLYWKGEEQVKEYMASTSEDGKEWRRFVSATSNPQRSHLGLWFRMTTPSATGQSREAVPRVTSPVATAIRSQDLSPFHVLRVGAIVTNETHHQMGTKRIARARVRTPDVATWMVEACRWMTEAVHYPEPSSHPASRGVCNSFALSARYAHSLRACRYRI